MRIVITGSKGLLGTCLSEKLKSRGIEVINADVPEYNIISFNSVKKLFKQPVDYLINCAAYTNVPQAEIDKKSAYFVNAQACGILARCCADNNTHLVHFSTDFVFDGLKNAPYVEEDVPNPLNCYGQSKLNGELIIKKNLADFTIFRLQWLFGYSSKTFFSKIMEKSKTENSLKIVQDEIGSPCSVDFVSEVLSKFLDSDRKKFTNQIYHLTHNNYCSRYESAKYFLDQINWKGELVPVLTSDFKDTVTRPKFGVMSNLKLSEHLQTNLGTWEEDIDNFIVRL